MFELDFLFTLFMILLKPLLGNSSNAHTWIMPTMRTNAQKWILKKSEKVKKNSGKSSNSYSESGKHELI